MKILFITAHPYLPQMYGGLQTSTNELCHNLVLRGYEVAVLGALMPNGFFGLWSRLKLKLNTLLLGTAATKDKHMGYSVWRSWFPWLVVQKVIAHEKPNLIVVLAVKPVQMALSAKPSGIPILIQLQDVEFSQHGGDFRKLGNVSAVANSRFTALKYKNEYGIDPFVIHPFIDPHKYKTKTTRETVVFINPHKFKGLEIALAVVRLCPDIPFTFVESWPLKEEERVRLQEELRKLPNLSLLKPQKDMRSIYSKCKILLAPSLWEEGYGRVATEAQLSGIPVVASTRGGLPEAVGPGGILVDPNAQVEDWVAAIRKLWDDNDAYEKFSIAASSYAGRPEIGLDSHILYWEKAILSAMSQNNKSKA